MPLMYKHLRHFGVLGVFAALSLSRAARSDVSAYVELGGSAVTGSANVELSLERHMALRAGVGAAPMNTGNYVESFRAVFPLGASVLLGPGGHQLELGGTYLANSENTWASNFGPALYGPLAGWRYTSPGPMGFLLRATFTPQFQQGRRFYDVFPFGVSAGIHF